MLRQSPSLRTCLFQKKRAKQRSNPGNGRLMEQRCATVHQASGELLMILHWETNYSSSSSQRTQNWALESRDNSCIVQPAHPANTPQRKPSAAAGCCQIFVYHLSAQPRPSLCATKAHTSPPWPNLFQKSIVPHSLHGAVDPVWSIYLSI